MPQTTQIVQDQPSVLAKYTQKLSPPGLEGSTSLRQSVRWQNTLHNRVVNADVARQGSTCAWSRPHIFSKLLFANKWDMYSGAPANFLCKNHNIGCHFGYWIKGRKATAPLPVAELNPDKKWDRPSEGPLSAPPWKQGPWTEQCTANSDCNIPQHAKSLSPQTHGMMHTCKHLQAGLRIWIAKQKKPSARCQAALNNLFSSRTHSTCSM